MACSLSLSMMSGWNSQDSVIPPTPTITYPGLHASSHSQGKFAETNIPMIPETPFPDRQQESGQEQFCNRENFHNSIAYINQELELLGLRCIPVESVHTGTLDPIFLMNRLHDVLVLYHKAMAIRDEVQLRNHRLSCDFEHQLSSYKRLKRSKEQADRETNQEREKLRQLNCKYKTMSGQIKADEEELRKLTAVQSSRDLQYKHEQKKKEKELNKLKERLHQLIADKAPDRKVGMDIMSLVGGADGRRATWKTGPGKQEEEMYQVLINNYEESRQELMQENSELRDCLLSLQRELSSLLKKTGDMGINTVSEVSNHVNNSNSSIEDEEMDSYSSRLSITDLDDGYFQMPCDIMRNQLQQMFKDTCDHISQSMKRSLVRNISKSGSSRRLSRSSVFNVSEKSSSDRSNSVTDSSEIERLKKQIQNYKAIIEQQEDLIQQTLASHSNSMENTFFHESQIQKEKETLSEERKLFSEERANFEKERKGFTDAAIRLAKEKKVFDTERAAFLKQQVLNMNLSRGSNTKKARSDGPSNRLLPATPVYSPAKSDSALDGSLPTSPELFRFLGLTNDAKADASPATATKLTSEKNNSSTRSFQSQEHKTPSPSTFHPSNQTISTPHKSIHHAPSPHEDTAALSHISNQSTLESYSQRLEAIKASLMKKHLERSQSKK